MASKSQSIPSRSRSPRVSREVLEPEPLERRHLVGKPGHPVVDPVGEEGGEEAAVATARGAGELASRRARPPRGRDRARLREQRRPQPAESAADDREVALGRPFERWPGRRAAPASRARTGSVDGVGEGAPVGLGGLPRAPTDRGRPRLIASVPCCADAFLPRSLSGHRPRGRRGALAGALGRRDGIGTVLLVARGDRRRRSCSAPRSRPRITRRGPAGRWAPLIAAGSFRVVSDFAAGAAARAEGGGFIAGADRARRARDRRALGAPAAAGSRGAGRRSSISASPAAAARRASTRACGRCGERAEARPLRRRLAAHRHPRAARPRTAPRRPSPPCSSAGR